MNEGKDEQKTLNPYAKPILGKCFKCNQPGHRSSDCPRRKAVNIVEREKEEEEFCYGPDGEDEQYEEDEVQVQSYILTRMMSAPKQEDKTQ